MTLAVSSSAGILAGLALLSTGLLAISLAVLIVGLQRDHATRQAARRTYEQVASEVAKAVEPGQTMATLLQGVETMLRSFRAARASPEGGAASGWDDFAQRASERASQLGSAHEAVLNLSIDELGFLKNREESELAALVTYVQAVERLEQELADARWDRRL